MIWKLSALTHNTNNIKAVGNNNNSSNILDFLQVDLPSFNNQTKSNINKPKSKLF